MEMNVNAEIIYVPKSSKMNPLNLKFDIITEEQSKNQSLELSNTLKTAISHSQNTTSESKMRVGNTASQSYQKSSISNAKRRIEKGRLLNIKSPKTTNMTKQLRVAQSGSKIKFPSTQD
jgi:hypothetical protein